jgi:serine/threonine protein kinase
VLKREEIAQRRIGRTLRGRWLLDAVIGVGGNATVYAATHRNGARAAIKMLHPDVNESQAVRSAFVREAWLANSIGHRGVPRVHDDDVDEDGTVYFVMDLFAGISLSRRARLRPLDDVEALEVGEQILEILSHAHAKGIVHRDVKPQNVLIDEAGRVGLVDFGIAHAIAAPHDGVYGTPGFMAPEQILGGQIGPHTDLWSVGATLFSVVTGEGVFLGRSIEEILDATAHAEPRSLREAGPWLPDDLIDIVDTALHRGIHDRYFSAAEMLIDIVSAKERRGLAPSPLVVRGPQRKISSRIRRVDAPVIEKAIDKVG